MSGITPKTRAHKAKNLCKEIFKEAGNSNYIILCNECNSYICEGSYNNNWDGRYFRDNFPHSYYGLEQQHELNRSFYTKSKEFQLNALNFLTLPEYCFEDYKII